MATFTATGAIFGAVDVVTVAFADELGHKAAASVVLALYAAGSCGAGLVFGLLRFTGAPERRWLLGICAMAVSMIPSNWSETCRLWPWRCSLRACPSHPR